MDTIDIKSKLQEELTKVESELAEISVQDPDSDEYEAVMPPTDAAIDDEEVADRVEDFEQNAAEIEVLEARRDMILRALEKVEEGTYGMCDMCENKIPDDRLEAHPSAITCVEHA